VKHEEEGDEEEPLEIVVDKNSGIKYSGTNRRERQNGLCELMYV